VFADDGAEYPEVQADTRPSAEHVLRLERLIEHQADELLAAEASRRELTAICDLAEWAAESTGDGTAAVVLVEDLRRLLARRHRTSPAADGSS
jgi:hypothetical protein